MFCNNTVMQQDIRQDVNDLIDSLRGQAVGQNLNPGGRSNPTE